MISPGEVVRKAERQYTAVLRAWLSGEVDVLFPMDFPAGRPARQLAKRRGEITALLDRAALEGEAGYRLEMKTVDQRRLGTQTYPTRVVIDTLDDYLAVVRKRTEFRDFCADADRIRARLPALEAWLHEYPHNVIAYAGSWPGLLDVCAYFVENPRPGVYVRELPIPVHTKFIEGHTKVLRLLLDHLLPPDAVDAETTDFARRYGLRDTPSRVRLRLLDGQLEWAYDLRLDDLSLPVAQAAHLLAAHIKPKRVVIVENLINFLTLPPIVGAVGLFGGGFRVSLARDLYWLRECDVIYWGDIDSHGFEILSRLRAIYPHTRSVMMDHDTLDAHREFAVEGPAVTDPAFDHLTDAERIAADFVTAHRLRLEQERLPHAQAVRRLQVSVRQ